MTSYETKRARSAAISRADSARGRDIAPFPPVQDPARRIAATANFRLFCESYFPHTFPLAWSPDHLRMIELIERVVLTGGLFAMAMPRGSGKTSLAEVAGIWAALTGARSFTVLLGSDETAAEELLDSIRTELSTNDLLYADFPEVLHPIRKLEGIAHRARGQLYAGEPTHILWSDQVIVLPTIRGSRASGAIIRVAGITGRVRGMKFKRPDGYSVRPDLVIPDDPQTDESARSPGQVATRTRILNGAVLGLAGPGKKIAALMPCTVIAPDDLADRFLNRNKNPAWQGIRTKLLYAEPTNKSLWDQYAALRADSLRAGNEGREATEFYACHRSEMDAGAQPAWLERFNPDELSAIQHALNLQLADKAAYQAEYQNEPLADKLGDPDAIILTPDQICAKTNGTPRAKVPAGCERITAFIDVQGKLLYWLVVAWSETFTGAVIDYGPFPDQRRAYYTLNDARRTMAHAYPKAGLEGRIHAALTDLTTDLLARRFLRPDGVELRIEKLLIDARWGDSTNTVYNFTRNSIHGPLIMPSMGRGLTASSVPWDQYTQKPGERLGHHWLIPSTKGKLSPRHVDLDTNYWKSFIHSRLAIATADKGSLTLFGHDPAAHRLLADHLTAEYAIKTEGRGRTVSEWKIKPTRPDNHFFDCLCGCAAAASMLGVRLPELAPPKKKPAKPRRKVTYLD